MHSELIHVFFKRLGYRWYFIDCIYVKLFLRIHFINNIALKETFFYWINTAARISDP